MSMNGAQPNSRRRSARSAFDGEDEGPPGKKSKTDGLQKGLTSNGAVTTSKTSGKPSGAAKGKTKKSYDEEEDGFSFSRKKIAKGQKIAVAEAVSEPTQGLPASPPPKPTPVEAAPPVTAPKKKARRRFDPDETTAVQPIKRRSARLSGENSRQAEPADQATDTAKPSRAKIQQIPGREHHSSDQTTVLGASPKSIRQDEPETVQTEKTRQPSKIPLPFADTPIIRRNKEMRKTSAEQHRRSSSGMRGRRASSLIDKGESTGMEQQLLSLILPQSTPTSAHGTGQSTPASQLQQAWDKRERRGFKEGMNDELLIAHDTNFWNNIAVPHTEVETKEFYKHISQDLPEPRRMKQLLSWCGTRALPEKPGGDISAEESSARLAARVIQEELLKEFQNKSEMSDWFSREDTTPATLVKKPNPRNVQNAVKLAELEAEYARLQESKASWDALLGSTTSSSFSDKPNEPSPQPFQLDLEPASLDASLLDPEQANILQSLLAPHSDHWSAPDSSASQPESSALNTTPHDIYALSSRLRSMAETLEFKTDSFTDGIHRINQYRMQADRVADRVLADTAEKLDEREGKKEDVVDTLRALGKAMSSAPAR
ncbi:hypothetical protein LTR66_006331 [Elasticomyces elasticus]|nr:hypothetical protein LTR66_006331 [Elasticomyces elasticus]